MKCPRCLREFDANGDRCPACGAPKPEMAGIFRTSIVRISSGRSDRVYRSVDDAPAWLRERLRRSTMSGNSGTILIADRAGRREIERTLENFPEADRLGVTRAMSGKPPLPRRHARKALALAALVALLALLALALWIF